MYDILPEEYWQKQNYLIYCNDILVSILKYADANRLTNEEIKFKNDQDVIEFQKQSDNELIEWLQNNGYLEEVKKLYYKHISFSLLADLCSYTFESFRSSEKGKLSVAYTLLRKPFKDNLFYLEWILANPDDFFNSFINQTSENYDINSRKFDKTKKKEIIKNACDKIYSTMYSSTLDFMYDLRYEKSIPYSLEGLWNKATHLITTCKHYHTGVENFNFIFATEENHSDMWNHYYRIVPYLLGYVVEVVEAIIVNFIPIDEETLRLNQILRTLHMLANTEEQLGQINDIIDAVVGAEMKVSCDNCCKKVKFNKFALVQSRTNWEINCPKCGELIDITRYFFND